MSELPPHPASCEREDCQLEGECMHYDVCQTRTLTAIRGRLAAQMQNALDTRGAFRIASFVTQKDLQYEVMTAPAQTEGG